MKRQCREPAKQEDEAGCWVERGNFEDRNSGKRVQLAVAAAVAETEDLQMPERSGRARKEEEEPSQPYLDSWRPKERRTDHREIEALFGQVVKKDW